MFKLDPSKSTQYGFIPHKLFIKDRPELKAFPFNIMFLSLANINGVDQSCKAIYLPDLSSYNEDERLQQLRYFNQCQKTDSPHIRANPPESYDNEDYIDLWCFKESGWYEGEKYIDGKRFSKSVGKDWRTFFVHLTTIGLASGEGCEFEPIK